MIEGEAEAFKADCDWADSVSESSGARLSCRLGVSAARKRSGARWRGSLSPLEVTGPQSSIG